MRDFSEKKSHKAPNLENEVTLYVTEAKAERPRIRITAERYKIEKNKQILSYYRVYQNDELLNGTYNLDKIPLLLRDARKKFRFEKMEDAEIEKKTNSTKRIKYSAVEII